MILNAHTLARYLEEQVKAFCDIAVVGISGGVDSATVASIATKALGKEQVYLLSMPYDEIDRATFNSRSKELADFLGCNHLIVPIGEATDKISASLATALGRSPDSLNYLTTGNTRARMRMASLYALASELTNANYPVKRGCTTNPMRVRVLGTGNASEDLIGYDTKGGDALADLFPIGELFKAEVYQLAAHYGVPKSILTAPPSAGLYPGQTDADELGFTYDELEPALRAIELALRRGTPDEQINAALPEFAGVSVETATEVVTRFKGNVHKHRAPKVVRVRGTEMVD